MLFEQDFKVLMNTYMTQVLELEPLAVRKLEKYLR